MTEKEEKTVDHSERNEYLLKFGLFLTLILGYIASAAIDSYYGDTEFVQWLKTG